MPPGAPLLALVKGGKVDPVSLDESLAALGRGDRLAAEPVFKEVWPVLRAVCGKWLRNAADAEDCAQAALVKLFAQADRYEPSKSAIAYAIELARWECFSARRRRLRVAPDGHQPTSADVETPEQHFEVRELEALLAQVVVQLSDKDREALRALGDGEQAGDAAARKRRQRAVERLKLLWRRLHGCE